MLRYILVLLQISSLLFLFDLVAAGPVISQTNAVCRSQSIANAEKCLNKLQNAEYQCVCSSIAAHYTTTSTVTPQPVTKTLTSTLTKTITEHAATITKTVTSYSTRTAETVSKCTRTATALPATTTVTRYKTVTLGPETDLVTAIVIDTITDFDTTTDFLTATVTNTVTDIFTDITTDIATEVVTETDVSTATEVATVTDIVITTDVETVVATATAAPGQYVYLRAVTDNPSENQCAILTSKSSYITWAGSNSDLQTVTPVVWNFDPSTGWLHWENWIAVSFYPCILEGLSCNPDTNIMVVTTEVFESSDLINPLVCKFDGTDQGALTCTLTIPTAQNGNYTYGGAVQSGGSAPGSLIYTATKDRSNTLSLQGVLDMAECAGFG